VTVHGSLSTFKATLHFLTNRLKMRVFHYYYKSNMKSIRKLWLNYNKLNVPVSLLIGYYVCYLRYDVLSNSKLEHELITFCCNNEGAPDLFSLGPQNMLIRPWLAVKTGCKGFQTFFCWFLVFEIKSSEKYNSFGKLQQETNEFFANSFSKW